MINRFFVLALCVLFFAGCATAGKNHALELQQCQSKISYLEQDIKEKDREIANLEYELQRKESESYRKSSAPTKTRSESSYSSTPSTTQIQKALKSAGYYKGSVDGKMGAKTQDAIIKFQKDNGLKADGKVGQMTWSELKFYLE